MISAIRRQIYVAAVGLMTSDLVKQIHVVIKWPTNNMENIAIAYFFLNKAVIVSFLWLLSYFSVVFLD
jgi:hypothetical protein